MTSVAARLSGIDRARARSLAVPATIVALAVLVGLSLLLRTRALLAGFWIDEGLSVGIASHGFTDIPSLLRLDGSPPLYYLALHVWMSIFGSGEGETHGMSVGFALLCIPAALWAGRSLGGTRAGWMAAVIAAIHPFLTYYAQETRMYALAALLSLLTSACFAHAFALRDRRFLAPFVIFAVLLIYTHNWGLFVLVGTVAALGLMLWRAPDERAWLLRDAAIAYGAIALLYAPWIPTLLFQAAHTGAPWATRPGPERLYSAATTALGNWTGGAIVGLVAGAGIAALLRRPQSFPDGGEEVAGREAARRGRAVEALVVLTVVALIVAWLASQAAPAWTTRYFAVLVGPSIVIGGVGLAHARKLGIAALILLLLLWSGDRAGQLNAKSNVRGVAARIKLRPVAPGDLILSTHPEQVPVLRYYLGDGFRYADPMGPVADPQVMDWRDALDRLRASRPTPTARALVDGMQSGQALILVQPILRAYYQWKAPWTALVRRRAIQWERVLQRDSRLRRVEALPRFGLSQPPRGVRAVVYRKR